jgi:magnesium transporter
VYDARGFVERSRGVILSRMAEIVDCALYRDGKRVEAVDLAAVPAALRECRDRRAFLWVDVFEPDASLLSRLQDAFSLHELAVEDALQAHQRPKVEDYGDLHFVVLRTATWREADKRIDLGERHVFIGPHFVVSVRHGSAPPYTPLGGEPDAQPERLRDGPRYVLYALLDFVADGYFPVVDALEDEVDGLEAALFAERSSADLSRRLYALHAEIARFRRAVAPLVDALDRITRNERLTSEEARPYYRDVHDQLLRTTERIDHIRDLVGSAVETNYALVSVRQNDIMKRLAAYAALVAVPTLVAGFYGMNFRALPGRSSTLVFWSVVAATAVGCVLLYRRFRRMDWL